MGTRERGRGGEEKVGEREREARERGGLLVVFRGCVFGERRLKERESGGVFGERRLKERESGGEEEGEKPRDEEG